MQRSQRLFGLIAWLTHRHMLHHQKIAELIGAVGAWFMKLAAPRIYEHAEAAIEQQVGLQELNVLNLCLEIKRAATLQGGWQDHHGVGLDQVAHILVQQHDWDPYDVGVFVEQLTDGHFVFASNDDDDAE